MKRRELLMMGGSAAVGVALWPLMTQADELPECEFNTVEEALEHYADGSVYINHESGVLHIMEDGQWVPVCQTEKFVIPSQTATYSAPARRYAITIPNVAP